MNKNEIRKAKGEMLGLFGAETLRELPDKVMEVCLGEKSEVFDRYLELYPDLSEDNLSKTFQELFADRAFLSQDFSPGCVGRIMAELALAGTETPPNEVLDEAAGAGALAVSYWAKNPDVVVYCREVSGDAIPFLLFNLMVRNIRGFVVQGDTLTYRTDRVFALSKGEKYSELTENSALPGLCTEKMVDPLGILHAAYNMLNVRGIA